MSAEAPVAIEADLGPQLSPIVWSKDGSTARASFQRCFLDDVMLDAEDVELWREALDICVEDAASGPVPCPIASFEELKVLPDYVLQSLRESGIQTPMPIQAQALPLVLSGHDVIGLANTGSGKTLAFLLPAIVHIEAQQSLDWGEATPIALVLAPTRELAVQIEEQASKVLKYSRRGNHRGGCYSACLYGGGSKQYQSKTSCGAHVVVATPGRLIDFLASKVMSLARVTYFVLDEADRMLDMGFQGDVAAISNQVRPERQVLFFSATWSKSVQGLAHGLCREGSQPVRISVRQKRNTEGIDNSDASGASRQARESIVQEVIVVDFPRNYERQLAEKERMLQEYIHLALSASVHNKVLVFVSQKNFADELCTKLWDAGFKVGAMHGGRPQESRLRTLERFRKSELQLLVATDVLGRGIDIPSVTHVVIFEMGYVEDYVHRIGRTARGQDAKGCALVFFEYYYKEPAIASDLIKVLEASKQPVPEGLRQIADEVAHGKRDVWDREANWGKGAVVKARDASEGIGVQGTWNRHVFSLTEPKTADGGYAQCSEPEGSGWKSDPRNVAHIGTSSIHTDRDGIAKSNGSNLLVLPSDSTTVKDWLAALDPKGQLDELLPAFQKSGLNTVGDIIFKYSSVNSQSKVEVNVTKLFREVGVSKYGHKQLIRTWIREREGDA